MSIFSKLFTKNRYDAAVHTRRNAEQWKYSDYLNSDQSLSPEVRRTLRSRCRYEVQNSSWLYGMIVSHAESIVGTGARLQIHGFGDEGNKYEQAFSEWAESVSLWKTIRTAICTEIRDGEAFIQLTNRPQNHNACKLYPLLLDAERICTPDTDIDTDDDFQADGIYFDKYLVPVRYSVAQEHPAVITSKHYTVDAEYMCHLFRQERPEQHRGAPLIASALPSIAMLRAYTIAMLAKMENSASVAGVLKPDPSVIDADSLADPPFTEFSMPQRSWVTLPPGYSMEQYQLQNPTDSQQSFATSVKIEAARCILATRNVVLGDSSTYNYSSARLDMQSYDRAIAVQRKEIVNVILDKVLRQWWLEMHPNETLPVHQWYFEAREYINPSQEANAEKTRLETGTVSYQALCAEHGRDWQSVMRQQYEAEAYRRKLAKEYGFNLPSATDENNQNGDQQNEEEEN